MFTGKIIAIRTAEQAKAPMIEQDYVLAAPGRGLVGDRYALLLGAFQKGEVIPEQEVTLIESEALEIAQLDYQVELSHAETRRNLLTAGVPLNHLVGREFRCGGVVLCGVKLCEPCGYLEKLTRPGVIEAFRHRGGLRAKVIKGGILRRGDVVTVV